MISGELAFVREVVLVAEGGAFVVTEMSLPGAERFNAPIAEVTAQMAVKVGPRRQSPPPRSPLVLNDFGE